MKGERNILLFFTSCFPYDTGETFIETEIKYLAEKFDQIIIVSNDTNSKTFRKVPANFKIFRFPYQLTFLEKIISLRYLFCRDFYQEMQIIKRIYQQPISLIIIKTLLVSMQTGNKTIKFIKNLLVKNNIQNNQLILYSYWNNNMTYGIARFKKQYPDVVAFTRAHGWDVYFERHKAKYLPLRSYIVNMVDAIFFVSEHGRNYFKNKLKGNIIEEKLKVNRLGVAESSEFKSKRKNSMIKIVSCSRMIALKRIDLIIKALAEIQNYRVEWVHVGDGEERMHEERRAMILLGKKDNIQYKFSGDITNDKVMEFYKNSDTDVFLNLSKDEGLPVTIMEAMSFGIPVISTNVGGVSEIVDNDNGILLSPNPILEEIKNAIDRFYYMDEGTFNIYRKNAYQTWKENYNAENNYRLFIEEVNSVSKIKSVASSL